MAAPMIRIEPIVMKMMYPDKKLNAILITGSVITALLFYMFIRQQAAISDKQFLRSMIPHHAGAILMSEQAAVQDPEIRELMRSIISSQQSEIDLMKRKLSELEK